MDRAGIERELAEIERFVEFWDRTERDARENVIQGRVRQAELLGRLAGRGGPDPLVAAATPDPAASPATTPAPGKPRLRSLAAQILVEALERAGPWGLSGGEMNRLVIDGGLSKDASEKAKVRIKRDGKVFHDEGGRRWYALDAVPAHLRGRMPRKG